MLFTLDYAQHNNVCVLATMFLSVCDIIYSRL